MSNLMIIPETVLLRVLPLMKKKIMKSKVKRMAVMMSTKLKTRTEVSTTIFITFDNTLNIELFF
jgi:hypothetical protein